MYTGFYRGSQHARPNHTQQKLVTRKLRICDSRPIPVETDADSSVSQKICDLEPRTVIDVCEEKMMPDGTVRVSTDGTVRVSKQHPEHLPEPCGPSTLPLLADAALRDQGGTFRSSGLHR